VPVTLVASGELASRPSNPPYSGKLHAPSKQRVSTPRARREVILKGYHAYRQARIARGRARKGEKWNACKELPQGDPWRRPRRTFPRGGFPLDPRWPITSIGARAQSLVELYVHTKRRADHGSTPIGHDAIAEPNDRSWHR